MELLPDGAVGLAGVVSLDVPEAVGAGLGRFPVAFRQIRGAREPLTGGQIAGHVGPGKTRDKTIYHGFSLPRISRFLTEKGFQMVEGL